MAHRGSFEPSVFGCVVAVAETWVIVFVVFSVVSHVASPVLARRRPPLYDDDDDDDDFVEMVVLDGSRMAPFDGETNATSNRLQRTQILMAIPVRLLGIVSGLYLHRPMGLVLMCMCVCRCMYV